MRTIILFLISFFILTLSPVLAKSGCCSWHNGVCGCNSGRVLCCDGTLSPSCTCLKESILDKNNLLAWDGYDWESNSDIEIDKGNLVRTGNDIEIYDYGTGEYKDVTVEGIERSGDTVELEVYDNESGSYRTLEMYDY